ncbi:ATP-dependent helicase [Planococcus maritimus]|uniref:DNA 3'-5' helicase n=1 Tax=Planococcus maritimus TaxID=192421 RepID=A0A7D7RMZ1_PLAMR|nr:ATP-dependent helicase [Planococcus maritimus]KYG59703.1 DNA helicase UvrD [Planococcus maritimus]QMT17039.1 ATP-dependent helicase [Planococcus maritimus]
MSDFFERKKQELGVELNKIQKKAVTKTEGPLLLLACPGSGKTTTMIMRIGYLIEEKSIQPKRIKAITFSRASATDMLERYARFFPGLAPVDFSTIHSLAFQITREYLSADDYVMIEGSDSNRLNKKRLLREIYARENDEPITDDLLEELVSFISFVKNKMVQKRKWKTLDEPFPGAIDILSIYEDFKENHEPRLVDFDDMLTIAFEALSTDRKLLLKYQQRWDYVMTDESQDTSMVQHALVEKLVEKHRNLCVVADDDQSIYTWRAAEPSYLLKFRQVYPDAYIMKMERNYRSSGTIVSTANRFIKTNKLRHDKNMFTDRPEGGPIVIRRLASQEAQLKYLLKELGDLEDYGNVAILYRNNSSSTLLMDELDRLGIPFYMKDADNRFFSHWIVQDILNFMRFSLRPERIDLYAKVASKTNAYWSAAQLKQLGRMQPSKQHAFEEITLAVTMKDYQLRIIAEQRKTVDALKDMPPLNVIKAIRRDIGYDQMLKSRAEKFGMKLDYLQQILSTLEQIAEPLPTMTDFAKRLKQLEEVTRQAKTEKTDDMLTLSTMHSSKGLEFDRVYLIDLVEGIVPTEEDADDPALLEEARRLFYVGMTRAKRHLELLSYDQESRFVEEVRRIALPKTKQTEATKASAPSSPKTKIAVPDNPDAVRSIDELQVGANIRHRVFGNGQITDLDEEKVGIQFAKAHKEFLLEICLQYQLLELI